MARDSSPQFVSPLVSLVVVGRMAEKRIEARLGEIDLSLRLLGALGHLAHRSDLSYSDLARRAGITPQSMRATVAELQARGVVSVTTAGQGVRVRLKVTRSGHTLLNRARGILTQLDEELLPGGLPASMPLFDLMNRLGSTTQQP